MALREGTVIGGYRIKAVIGAGGMGTVYSAADRTLERTVAVKVLADNLSTDDNHQRFAREAQIAASLSSPHVVHIYDQGLDPDRHVLWMSMEFVDGPTLAEVVKSSGALPFDQVTAILDGLAEAIDHAHGRGLLHRDIKPANVLMAGDTFPKLADFGIARSIDATAHTSTNPTMGYAAPEGLLTDSWSAASDLYSLACLAFVMTTGRLPFAHNSDWAMINAHAEDDPPAVSTFRPDAPARLDAVFAQALAKEPEQRYSTARQFANAVRGALGDSHTVDRVAGAGSSDVGDNRRRSFLLFRRRRVVVLGVLAVVVALIGAAATVVATTGLGHTDSGSQLPQTPWSPVTLPQQFGGTLTLNDRPGRIAALGASDAEIVHSFGVTPVAASNGQDPRPPRWAGLNVPSAGTTANPDLAALRRADPDLIIDTDPSLTAETFSALSKIAPVLYSPPSLALLRLDERVKWIARAIGQTAAIPVILSRLNKEIGAARDSLFVGKKVAVVRYSGGDEFEAAQSPTWTSDLMSGLGFTYDEDLDSGGVLTNTFMPLTEDTDYKATVDMDLIVVLRTDIKAGRGGFSGLPKVLYYNTSPVAVIDDPELVSAVSAGGPMGAATYVPALASTLREALSG